jgi:hypothetical protein
MKRKPPEKFLGSGGGREVNWRAKPPSLARNPNEEDNPLGN